MQETPGFPSEFALALAKATGTVPVDAVPAPAPVAETTAAPADTPPADNPPSGIAQADTAPEGAMPAAAAIDSLSQSPSGRRAPPTPKKPMPNRRSIHPALEKLFALYPALFGARFLPLKLGIFQDILALNPDSFEKDELRAALGLHTRSLRYLECVAAGMSRHDLQGQPVEPVATGHIHHAIIEVFRRHQSRTLDDLRPELQRRLANAIEASGLNRDGYLACVQTQDEALLALLDGAFAEFDARTARREALLRAYDSSGLNSAATFADQYGCGLAVIEEALHRRNAVNSTLATQEMA